MREENRFLEYPSRDHALDLPPLFRAVALREGGDAFAHACAIAADAGAGTLVHVGAFHLADLALVLEPEMPLSRARGAFYVGMLALGYTLAAQAPAEKPITIGWPDALFIDGGLVGGGRLAWPAESDEAAVPPWLVFGATIRLSFPAAIEPGHYPAATALTEEGFEAPSSARVAEGLARHFMMLADSWQKDGFEGIAHAYLDQLESAADGRNVLADNGDLLIERRRCAVEYRSLRTALLRPSWLASETLEPRL